jgi:undecaprenyl-diphosphatase
MEKRKIQEKERSFFMIMILLAIVLQILIESLPISSSGHLHLLTLFGKYHGFSQEAEYVLYGPTLIVLALYFAADWWPLVRHWYRYRFVLLHFALMGFVAEIVTILIYGILQKVGVDWFPLPLGFALTGCLLLSLSLVPPKHIPITSTKAALIGLMQGIALLPGISRLGSTYVVGCWLSLSPRRSFAFSCALEWPLIAAGFGKGLYSISANDAFISLFISSWPYIIVAMIGAYGLLFFTEYLARTQRLWWLGWYMFLPCVLAIACR